MRSWREKGLSKKLRSQNLKGKKNTWDDIKKDIIRIQIVFICPYVNSNERSVSIRLRYFIGWLSNSQLLKDDHILLTQYYLILITTRIY